MSVPRDKKRNYRNRPTKRQREAHDYKTRLRVLEELVKIQGQQIEAARLMDAKATTFRRALARRLNAENALARCRTAEHQAFADWMADYADHPPVRARTFATTAGSASTVDVGWSQ